MKMKMKMIKIFCLLIAILLICNIRISAEYKLPFTDVSETSWYYNSLYDLYSNNVISGFPDGTFKGNETVTKEQYIKMLVAILFPTFKPTSTTGTWFKPYYDMALQYDIALLNDYNVDVRSKQMTREEVVYYTYKALKTAKYEEYILKEFEDIIKNVHQDFTDTKDMKPEYESAFQVLYDREMISGYNDGTLKPKKLVTRAETTSFLDRLEYVRNYDIARGRINIDELFIQNN